MIANDPMFLDDFQGFSTRIQPFPGQLPRGDLYVNTSPRRGELPRTPNWTSARREMP